MDQIAVLGYTKVYGDFTAVHDLSFSVAAGEILGLCGPNGAGKTTTLRALAGILQPTRGIVRVAGHDLAIDPIPAKRALAFVPDEPALFEHLTVSEHLELIARLYGVPDYLPRAQAILSEVELTEKKDDLPQALSRGMKQKLSLACALLHAPRAIILDEPLTGLDPVGIRRMKDTIMRCAREGAAVVLSSHLLSLVEEMCQRVLIIKRGQRVFLGSKAEIVESYPGLSLEEVFLKLTQDGQPPASLPPTPALPPQAGGGS
ncbi:MAG TPA: ABC transporter ATP-binding protein [Planctomycetota bacterium]|nr:ABC transporter ATP-binding protein [Planctomycetota bacterium]